MKKQTNWQFEVYFNENSGLPYKDTFKISAIDEDSARSAAYRFADEVFKDRPGFDPNRTIVMEVEDATPEEIEEDKRNWGFSDEEATQKTPPRD